MICSNTTPYQPASLLTLTYSLPVHDAHTLHLDALLFSHSWETLLSFHVLESSLKNPVSVLPTHHSSSLPLSWLYFQPHQLIISWGAQ